MGPLLFNVLPQWRAAQSGLNLISHYPKEGQGMGPSGLTLMENRVRTPKILPAPLKARANSAEAVMKQWGFSVQGRGINAWQQRSWALKQRFKEAKHHFEEPEDRFWRSWTSIRGNTKVFIISRMFFHKGQVPHTVFIMHRVPEGAFRPSYCSKQSNIHEADLPASSFILFKSPEVLQPKGQIVSGADFSFTRKVTMIKYAVYQTEWASALHSLLCLNITFKDSPTSSVGPLCLFCYKAQRDIIVKVVVELSVNCKHFVPSQVSCVTVVW